MIKAEMRNEEDDGSSPTISTPIVKRRHMILFLIALSRSFCDPFLALIIALEAVIHVSSRWSGLLLIKNILFLAIQ